MLTIFHKNVLDLRERTEEEIRVEEVIPGDDPPDKDLIDVINPSTGVVEKNQKR